MIGPGPGPDGGRNCLWGPDPPEKRRGVAGRRCAPSCPSRCCSLLLLQEGTGGHASASAVPTLLRVRVRFSTAWIVPTASLMRNDLLNTACRARMEGRKVTKMLKVTPRGSHKSRPLSEVVLTDAVGVVD